MRASDIHIEPCPEDICVRVRIDGDLHEMMRLSKNSLSAITTRIKIMGRMDIAEKRIPQDVQEYQHTDYKGLLHKLLYDL